MNAKQLKLLVTAHVWRSGELWFSPSTTGVIRPRGRSLKLLSHLGGSPGFHLLVTDHYITKEMKICTEGFPVSSEIWYLTWQAAATVTIIYGWEQNLGSPLLPWSLGKLSVFQGACFGGLPGLHRCTVKGTWQHSHSLSRKWLFFYLHAWSSFEKDLLLAWVLLIWLVWQTQNPRDSPISTALELEL